MNPEEILISDAMDEWLVYCRRHSERTQEQYRYTIHLFVASLPEEVKLITQIHSRHIENYISGLLDRGLLNSTANAGLHTLKSFHRWLSRHYNIPNPTAKVEPLKPQPPKQRFLLFDEYQKILAVPKTEPLTKRNCDIVRFLYHTGLRASEFVNVKCPDISPDLKKLTIIGKGRKRRCVPLNAVCREILEKYQPNENRPSFIPNSRRTLNYICHWLAKRAGIPSFGPHAARHLNATELLRRGVPVANVSRLLGHSSIATTERIYIHWLPEYNNGWTDCLTE